MIKMLSWKPHMAWSVLLPHLQPFLLLSLFLHQYITPGSSEYYHLYIYCLFLYINPSCWLTSSGSRMLVHLYCFEPNIEGLLIFEQYLWHLLFYCWCLLLEWILPLLLLLYSLLLPTSWYSSLFSAHLSSSPTHSMSCDITLFNLLFSSSWLEPGLIF